MKRKDKQIANVVRYSDEKRRRDRAQLESLREELRSKEKVSEENAQLQLEIENLREQMAEQNTHFTRQMDSVKEQLRKSEGEFAEQNAALESEVENLTKIVEKREEDIAEQNTHLTSQLDSVREQLRKSDGERVIIEESKNKIAEQNAALESEVRNLTKKVEKHEETATEQNEQCRRAIEAANREFAIWRLEAKMKITQKDNELFELKKDFEALTSKLVKIKKAGKMKARLLGCLRRIFRRRH